MRNKAWMIWLLAALLILLCACGGPEQTEEPSPDAVPVVAEEETEDEPEAELSPALFAVTDYYGNVTISPAEDANCELVSNDGNTCVFRADVDMDELAQRMQTRYSCIKSDVTYSWETEQCCYLMFIDEADSSKVTAVFLVAYDGENLILSNRTAELLMEDGTSVRVLFPWEWLMSYQDFREPLQAGVPYLIQSSKGPRKGLWAPFGGDFIEQRSVLFNGSDTTLPYGELSVLYDFSSTERGTTLTLSEYAPYEPQWAGSLRETVDQAVAFMRQKNPALTAVELTLEKDALILVLDLPQPAETMNCLNWFAWKETLDAEQLIFSFEEMGLTRTETAEALQTLSLPDLAWLIAWNWPLEDLNSLRGFPALRRIDVAFLNYTFDSEEERGILSDISALQDMENLASLAASRNSISDVTPLASCGQLYYVDLYDNLIRDARPLTQMVSQENGIHFLGLSHNPLEQISDMDLPDVSGEPRIWEEQMSIGFEGTAFEEQSVYYIIWP